MTYAGANADTLAIKQQELSFYLQAQQAFASGVQSYRIGSRELNPEVFRVLMDGQKANLVVADPPYNVNYSAQAGSIKNDNLKDEEFYKFLLKAFTNMAENMEKDASIYVFHADTEGYNFRKAFQDAGLYLSGVCIWAKPKKCCRKIRFHPKPRS